MPRCEVKILPSAWKGLEEIAEYHLLIVGPVSTKRITDRILTALDRLEEFPLSAPFVPDAELKDQDYRMLVCDGYICIYRLLGDTVYVFHIAHGSTEYGILLRYQIP